MKFFHFLKIIFDISTSKQYENFFFILSKKKKSKVLGMSFAPTFLNTPEMFTIKNNKNTLVDLD